MPSKYGLEWSGTSNGKLEESNIPDPPEHRSHYLYDEDTKSESSYPLVGGEENLRRGNVSSAWELGARGGVDSDEHDRKLKELGKEFDNNPIPDDAYEEDMSTVNVKRILFEPSESERDGSDADFQVGMDREQVFSMWDEMTNMPEEAMEMWDDHPCADAGVDGGENVRDETLMLMGQAPDGWDENSYRIANEHLSHIMEAMEMEPPEDAGSAGPGTCPSRWAINLLNRGVNPFDEMPSGNPQFDSEGDSSTGSVIDLPNRQRLYASDEELDDVYSEWSDTVNMTASQLESWAEHACSDIASNDPTAVRERNMRLLEKDKSEWTEKDISDAKRTISFISRMRGQRPDSPASGGKGTCPSEWAVSLLNWAYNPFDGMPDGDPNPDGEQNNSLEDGGLVYSDGEPIEMSFAATPIKEQIREGFNQYGIRENYDGDELVSVDAIYEAMEPGPPESRKGVRITEDFLKSVSEKDYSNRPPFMMDHDRSTLSHVGFVDDVWFDDGRGKLMVQVRAYNTGAQTHDEIIKRLTHEPPAITDGSVGFGRNYEASKNSNDEYQLEDGKMQEFSTTPFPGGYDEGGLRAAGSGV